MFKRFLAWWRGTEPSQEVWNFNKAAEQFTAWYGLPVVIEAPVTIDDDRTEVRQVYLDSMEHTPFGHSDYREFELASARKKESNRAWIIRHMPDECLFR